MENETLLRQYEQEVEQWIAEQKDIFFWEKLGRLPFVYLDKLMPKVLHAKLGVALDELIKYVDYGSDYLSDRQTTLETIRKHTGQFVAFDDIGKLPIAKMDEAAQKFVTARQQAATIQGATTGLGGILTLSIDIPFLLGLTIKTLQEVAICYGYDPNDKEERLVIMKCMQFASADMVGKKAIISELTAASGTQTLAQIQGWREVFLTYRDNFGWKKLFQMVPIFGMLFGAFINRQTIADVGEVGRMLYKWRRTTERLNK